MSILDLDLLGLNFSWYDITYVTFVSIIKLFIEHSLRVQFKYSPMWHPWKLNVKLYWKVFRRISSAPIEWKRNTFSFIISFLLYFYSFCPQLTLLKCLQLLLCENIWLMRFRCMLVSHTIYLRTNLSGKWKHILLGRLPWQLKWFMVW